jgi:hypothetical protein
MEPIVSESAPLGAFHTVRPGEPEMVSFLIWLGAILVRAGKNQFFNIALTIQSELDYETRMTEEG